MSNAALTIRIVEVTTMHSTSATSRSPTVQNTVMKVSAPTSAAAASHRPGSSRLTRSPQNRSRRTPPPVAVITATRIAEPKLRPSLSAFVAPTSTQTPMNKPSMTSINMVARAKKLEKIQPNAAPTMA